MECPFHKGTDLPEITVTNLCPSCHQKTDTEVIAYGPCVLCGLRITADGTQEYHPEH